LASSRANKFARALALRVRPPYRCEQLTLLRFGQVRDH